MRRVIMATVLPNYHVEVTFDDNKRKKIDLSKMVLKEGLFSELRDPEYFKTMSVDHDLRTICWPNSIDVCPDLLYDDGVDVE